MLCSKIPEYPTGHPGNNWGDKGSKILHDCYWVIQNFLSLSSSTYPARYFLLSSTKKEGSSITDRQWKLIHLDFLSSFFKNWQKLENAVWSQHFFCTHFDWEGTCHLSLMVQKRWKKSSAQKTSDPNHCLFERTLSINRQCSSSPFLQAHDLGISQTLSYIYVSAQPCHGSTSASLKHYLLSGLHTDLYPNIITFSSLAHPKWKQNIPEGVEPLLKITPHPIPNK